MMDQIISTFKFQLNFGSFVKFTAFIGFCFGVCSIPLVILSNFSNPKVESIDWLYSAPFILIGTPIVATLYGVFMGALGYPLYKWLSKRIGVKYTGSIYKID